MTRLLVTMGMYIVQELLHNYLSKPRLYHHIYAGSRTFYFGYGFRQADKGSEVAKFSTIF
jgi:hypothetical protein